MLKRVLIKSFCFILCSEMIISLFSWGLLIQSPFIWLSVTLAISIFLCSGIVIPLEIEKAITSSINKEIGKYHVIRRLNGFSSTLSMSGEMLVLSNDDKFYRVVIERATISNISALDNNITKTLV